MVIITTLFGTGQRQQLIIIVTALYNIILLILYAGASISYLASSPGPPPAKGEGGPGIVSFIS